MVSWLNRVICVSIRSYLIVIALTSLAHAQAEDSAGLTDSTDAMKELVEQGSDSLTEKYEDVAREYGGFRRTPIFFKSNSVNGSAHPGLSIPGLDVGMNPSNYNRRGIAGSADYPSLGATALDLSVDDEIAKSSMAPFQNTVSTRQRISGQQTMQDSFLENESERDVFLDSFQTARAIAIMTLSYLDKTVAAGLATSQDQADKNTIHQLLKEMNKSMSKIARPDRARVFDDQDDKFEICMQGIRSDVTPSAEKVPLEEGKAKPFPFVWDPFEACQLNVLNSKFCGGPKAWQTSRYHFCSCCAESSSVVNKSTVVPYGNNRKRALVSGEGFSVIDRVFMGTTVPSGCLKFDTDGGTTSAYKSTSCLDGQYDAGNAILDFSAMARSFYGDILFTPKWGLTKGQFNGGSDSGTRESTGKLTMKMATPLFSIQQWVKAIRDFSEIKNFQPYKNYLDTFNKKSDAGESCSWINNEGMWLRYCPSFGGAVRWGIAPALKQLIKLEKDNKLNEYQNDESTTYSFTDDKGQTQTYTNTDGNAFTRKDAVVQMWSEASLGGILLSRADLTLMAELDGTSDGQRIIAAFCDTSAVEAIKRLHRKLVTLSNDLLAANRKATTSDKNDVLALIKRVDDQLKAGTDDSRSKVDEIMIALDGLGGRRREAIRSSLVATGNASGRSARQGASRFSWFGGAYVTR